MWNILIIFFATFPSLCRSSLIEAIPERIEVEYYNSRFINNINITIRKTSRRSPYTAYVSLETLTKIGENLTYHIAVLEKLSGRYMPTMIEMTIPVCKMLDEGSKFFEIAGPVFPYNVTCPIPAGKYEFKLDPIPMDLPFNLPFTWDPILVHCRSDVEFFGYPYGKKLVLLKYKAYGIMKQKPTTFHKNMKKKMFRSFQ